MKKLVSLFLVLFMCLSISIMLVACSSKNSNSNNRETGANELIALSKDATLHIGTSVAITNSILENTTDMYLTYTSHITYSLSLDYLYSNEDIPDNYFQVSEGSRYYYHWDIYKVTDQALLGKRTEKTECTSSYLPYGDGESIMVKTTAVTSYLYDYNGGFVEKDITYDVDLNGYFTTFEELAIAYPDLAKYAYTGNTSDKYYVDTNTPTRTTTESRSYTDTYYYITYQNTSAESTFE